MASPWSPTTPVGQASSSWRRQLRFRSETWPRMVPASLGRSWRARGSSVASHSRCAAPAMAAEAPALGACLLLRPVAASCCCWSTGVLALLPASRFFIREQICSPRPAERGELVSHVTGISLRTSAGNLPIVSSKQPTGVQVWSALHHGEESSLFRSRHLAIWPGVARSNLATRGC